MLRWDGLGGTLRLAHLNGFPMATSVQWTSRRVSQYGRGGVTPPRTKRASRPHSMRVLKREVIVSSFCVVPICCSNGMVMVSKKSQVAQVSRVRKSLEHRC